MELRKFVKNIYLTVFIIVVIIFGSYKCKCTQFYIATVWPHPAQLYSQFSAHVVFKLTTSKILYFYHLD